MMKKLCKALDIIFYPSMLQWPSGARSSDGVWGVYWQKGVYDSTGFKPYTKKEINIDQKLANVYEKCKKHYDTFYNKRMKLQTLGKNPILYFCQSSNNSTTVLSIYKTQ